MMCMSWKKLWHTLGKRLNSVPRLGKNTKKKSHEKINMRNFKNLPSLEVLQIVESEG